MNILNRILEVKREEVTRLKAAFSPGTLENACRIVPQSRDFLAAVRGTEGIPIIAEIKRASPSGGLLRPIPDVTDLALAYYHAGAAALSVLTDRQFFRGSIQDLVTARQSCFIPVLRKDFIVDELQVYESRVFTADAVLLIVRALGRERLRDLFTLSVDLGMTPLVEVHDEWELEIALEVGPPLVGINNRNLDTLEIDLETSRRLRALVPDGVAVVAESGIRGPEDITYLRNAGIDAFLVGTTLMKSADPGATLAELRGAETNHGEG